jgi:NitT/TauT family transport system permease protein
MTASGWTVAQVAVLPTFSRPFFKGRAPFTWYDLPVALGVFALIWGLVSVGRGMTAPALPESLEIHLGLANVPYYLLRSVARMFIAYSWALVFTFVVGSMAAHSRTAERVILPMIDILQSVPILGFLAVTVNFFLALFPGSMLGIELASIFAIFTSQAWNIVYSFFQSVRAIPRDLSESATIYGLSPVQRFVRLEVPYSMIGLVWNSMVSFGGGWFFLAASEAISVLGTDLRLPGIGSYLATAVEAGDYQAVGIAIVAMLVVVVALDLLFFRPLLAWAQRFQTGGALDVGYESGVLTALQRSRLIEWLGENVVGPASSFLVNRLPVLARRWTGMALRPVRRQPRAASWTRIAALVALGAYLLYAAADAAVSVVEGITAEAFLEIVLAGLATFGRVAATVILATVVWLPIGTYIGMRHGLARRLRPVIQIGAAFPANLVFPIMVIVFARLGVHISVGSVLMMFVATQWYVLFNVIVGALAIPEELVEVARVMRWTRLQRFRHLIVPVVFPYWVTGALTAAGGAWNASIITEVATFGDEKLSCFGLGSYIARATWEGFWPGIVVSIAWMCFLVVLTNRLLWRRLYRYAEEHLAMEG